MDPSSIAFLSFLFVALFFGLLIAITSNVVKIRKMLEGKKPEEKKPE